MKDISQIIGKAKKAKSWVVKDLILKGDQIMIAAAPKSGKSLLASQLALCAATGHPFLRWLVPVPVKVLYFNLEVNEDIFTERFEMQAMGIGLPVQADSMLVESEIKSFNIAMENDFQKLKGIIHDCQAELVIFDVLSRTHAAQENDNSQMKEILLALRKVCGRAASVVIHHSRKAPQGMQNANLGASSMRGASAVHGEVDLAMTLVKDDDQNVHSIKFSARNIREPEEMVLKLAEDTLLFNETSKPVPPIAAVLQDAFQMSPRAPVSDVQAHVARILGIDQRQVQRHMAAAAKQNLVSGPIRDGKSYYYEVLNKNQIDCFDDNMPKAA
jgi:hypothetical protein